MSRFLRRLGKAEKYVKRAAAVKVLAWLFLAAAIYAFSDVMTTAYGGELRLVSLAALPAAAVLSSVFFSWGAFLENAARRQSDLTLRKAVCEKAGFLGAAKMREVGQERFLSMLGKWQDRAASYVCSFRPRTTAASIAFFLLIAPMFFCGSIASFIFYIACVAVDAAGTFLLLSLGEGAFIGAGTQRHSLAAVFEKTIKAMGAVSFFEAVGYVRVLLSGRVDAEKENDFYGARVFRRGLFALLFAEGILSALSVRFLPSDAVNFVPTVFWMLLALLPAATLPYRLLRYSDASKGRYEAKKIEAFLEEDEPSHPFFDPINIPEKADAGSLAFSEAAFTDSGDYKLFTSLDLEVPAGSFAGVTGMDQKARSTFAKLAAGELMTVRGSVLIDGIAVEKYLAEDLTHRVCLTDGASAFFEGTIKDNLLENTTGRGEDEVMEVLEGLGLTDFADRCGGLSGRISEETEMTKGEKARLLMCRALLTDSEILVFDGITDDVDEESRLMLLGAMRKYAGRRTIVLAAEAPEDFISCDFIFLLENGIVTAQGTFREFLSDINTRRFSKRYADRSLIMRFLENGNSDIEIGGSRADGRVPTIQPGAYTGLESLKKDGDGESEGSGAAGGIMLAAFAGLLLAAAIISPSFIPLTYYFSLGDSAVPMSVVLIPVMLSAFLILAVLLLSDKASVLLSRSAYGKIYEASASVSDGDFANGISKNLVDAKESQQRVMGKIIPAFAGLFLAALLFAVTCLALQERPLPRAALVALAFGVLTAVIFPLIQALLLEDAKTALRDARIETDAAVEEAGGFVFEAIRRKRIPLMTASFADKADSYVKLSKKLAAGAFVLRVVQAALSSAAFAALVYAEVFIFGYSGGGTYFSAAMIAQGAVLLAGNCIYKVPAPKAKEPLNGKEGAKDGSFYANYYDEDEEGFGTLTPLKAIELFHASAGEGEGAVTDLSVQCKAGKIVGISTKSRETMVKLADAVLHGSPLTTGKTFIVDENNCLVPQEKLHRSLSYLIFDADLLPFTLKENVRASLPNASSALVRAATRRGGLGTLAGDFTGPFTQSQALGIGLSRILIRSGTGVVLAEPTANVRAVDRGYFFAAIRKYCEDRPVLLLSGMEDELRMCDVVIDAAGILESRAASEGEAGGAAEGEAQDLQEAKA